MPFPQTGGPCEADIAGGDSSVRLIVASANPAKAAEIMELLDQVGHVELIRRPLDVPEPIEDGDTFLDNARIKARALVIATGIAAVADDTGLEVAALEGAPGVHTARYAGPRASAEDNIAKLLDALDGVEDRRARWRTLALIAYPDGHELWAEGVCEGRIGFEPWGSNGFGYDPIFIPDEGDGRTFAEMSADEKHDLSHRGQAFRILAKELDLEG